MEAKSMPVLPPANLPIWTNARFDPESEAVLQAGIGAHPLIRAAASYRNILVPDGRDPAFPAAVIAFGQPHPEDCLAGPALRWVALTTAGYARFDTVDIRESFLRDGIALTSASNVFADPCAQHLLAQMLALARQLPQTYAAQAGDHTWNTAAVRGASRLLTGQTVVFLGFGAIARRLVELLAPFRMRHFAVRRQARSERGVHVVAEEELTRILPLADHVVNVLPENDSTTRYVNARRIQLFKPGARFYNVGRGTTVDQDALVEALQSGRLGAASLDVADPEPLPPDHPLWFAPNCHITPHSAGGRSDQDIATVRHFLRNLAAFDKGEPLTDRVI